MPQVSVDRAAIGQGAPTSHSRDMARRRTALKTRCPRVIEPAKVTCGTDRVWDAFREKGFLFWN